MGGRFEIRALREGERDAWRTLAGPHADRTSHAETPEELFAFRGGELRAGMRGYFHHKKLYSALAYRAEDPESGHALLAAFARRLAVADAELLAWEPEHPALAGMLAALPSAGFREGNRKIFAERSLAGDLPPATGPRLAFAPLSVLGEEAFVPLLAEAAAGDPFEEVTDPWRSFAELKEHAGPAFDPRAWQAALLDRVPCGVALPQIYHDEPESGTLFYLGVLPAFRGRGIGRRLHREGLALLAALGAKRYKGSTDERNAAMARIFAANGCAVTKRMRFFRPAEGAVPHEA